MSWNPPRGASLVRNRNETGKRSDATYSVRRYTGKYTFGHNFLARRLVRSSPLARFLTLKSLEAGSSVPVTGLSQATHQLDADRPSSAYSTSFCPIDKSKAESRELQKAPPTRCIHSVKFNNSQQRTAKANGETIALSKHKADAAAQAQHHLPKWPSPGASGTMPDLRMLDHRTVNSSTNDDGGGKCLGEHSELGIQNSNIDDHVADHELPRVLERLRLAYVAEEKSKEETRFEIPVFKGSSFSCAKDRAVELRDGTFLRIETVFQNGKSKVFLRGRLLVREASMCPAMPGSHNEIIWVEMTRSGKARVNDTPVAEIPVCQVLRNREIVFTNQPYPMVSAEEDSGTMDDQNQDYRLGPLFCRWRANSFYDSAGKIRGYRFQRLLYQDADSKSRLSRAGEEIFPRTADCRNRAEWRRISTTLGGNHDTEIIVREPNGRTMKQRIKRYTIGDSFCGAGGVSRGALDAGLHVAWGFDQNRKAIQSYKANFRLSGTDCRDESVDKFLSQARHGGFLVDILHASPPCQPFSWAKTRPTPAADEQNEAALFSVGQLIQATKPRIVTMEETDGLVSLHRQWFDALLRVFIDKGYSVQWKIMRCEEYGVPQKRKRLVIIAAGPGERLPDFPEPTHGPHSASGRPLVSIADAIGALQRGDPDHEPYRVHRFDVRRTALDSNGQAKTLTCNGGAGNYHPDGFRVYTVRECACLQTFPIYHKFFGALCMTEMKKQIGNAVPPMFAKAWFKEIIKSLKDSDNA